MPLYEGGGGRRVGRRVGIEEDGEYIGGNVRWEDDL